MASSIDSMKDGDCTILSIFTPKSNSDLTVNSNCNEYVLLEHLLKRLVHQKERRTVQKSVAPHVSTETK
eukprot:1087796-Amphidinium_carterae.1